MFSGTRARALRGCSAGCRSRVGPAPRPASPGGAPGQGPALWPWPPGEAVGHVSAPGQEIPMVERARGRSKGGEARIGTGSGSRRLLPGGLTALLCLVWAPMPTPAAAQAAAVLPSIAEKTEGMTRIDGFIPMHWDERAGRLWLEIGRWEEEILHYTSLPAGLG